MEKEQRKILDEFIEGTPLWLNEMEKMNTIAGKDTFEGKESKCPFCGINPHKIKILLEAVKILDEKAWKYDDLSE